MNTTYTIAYTYDWFKHDDCRNAYRVHADGCQGICRDEGNGAEVYTGMTLPQVANNIGVDIFCRFEETEAEFGHTQMIGVCKCAGGKAVKAKILEMFADDYEKDEVAS